MSRPGQVCWRDQVQYKASRTRIKGGILPFGGGIIILAWRLAEKPVRKAFWSAYSVVYGQPMVSTRTLLSCLHDCQPRAQMDKVWERRQPTASGADGGFPFSQRFSGQVNTMSPVDQSIHDGIAYGRIGAAQVVMPFAQW